MRDQAATPVHVEERVVRPYAPWAAEPLLARLGAWSAHATDVEIAAGEDGPRIRLAVGVPSGAAVVSVDVDRGDPDASDVAPTRADPNAADPTAAGPTGAGHALLRFRVGRDDAPLRAGDTDAAVATLRHAWGLDDDLVAFDEAAEGDPPFAEVADRLRGARVVRHLSVAEALAWTLIRQRTPHGFARASLLRLRDALGSTAQAYGRTWTAFPDRADLADDAARPGLLAATNNTRKVDRLHAASETLASLDLGWLRTGPVDEVRRALGRAHGVGAWTVDYLMLLGLGRFERVPWTDTGLAQAVADLYAGGLTLDRGTMRTLAARYQGFGGVWAHWLKRARHGWRGY